MGFATLHEWRRPLWEVIFDQKPEKCRRSGKRVPDRQIRAIGQEAVK